MFSPVTPIPIYLLLWTFPLALECVLSLCTRSGRTNSSSLSGVSLDLAWSHEALLTRHQASVSDHRHSTIFASLSGSVSYGIRVTVH